MASVGICYGGNDVLVVNGTIEDVSECLKDIARVIANRAIPEQISRPGNRLYRLVVHEFLKNVMHGIQPVVEIDELQNGVVILTGVDRIIENDPVVAVSDNHFGGFIIDRIAGESYTLAVNELGQCRAQATIDPERVLAYATAG